MDLSFGACDPRDAIGNERHQVMQAVGIVWFGLSGGGAFDEEGNLVGVLTHIETTVPVKCDEDETNVGGPLWGWLVGPKTIANFWRR